MNIERLKEIEKNLLNNIRKSDCYIGFFYPSWEEDPGVIYEIAFAMALDKPIAIIACSAVKVPDNFKRVAFLVEYADSPEEVAKAVKKIIKTMRQV